eukprot:7372157-Alexandrium_andersonii.AAC.1
MALGQMQETAWGAGLVPEGPPFFHMHSVSDKSLLCRRVLGVDPSSVNRKCKGHLRPDHIF